MMDLAAKTAILRFDGQRVEWFNNGSTTDVGKRIDVTTVAQNLEMHVRTG